MTIYLREDHFIELGARKAIIHNNCLPIPVLAQSNLISTFSGIGPCNQDFLEKCWLLSYNGQRTQCPVEAAYNLIHSRMIGSTLILPTIVQSSLQDILRSRFPKHGPLDTWRCVGVSDLGRTKPLIDSPLGAGLTGVKVQRAIGWREVRVRERLLVLGGESESNEKAVSQCIVETKQPWPQHRLFSMHLIANKLHL